MWLIIYSNYCYPNVLGKGKEPIISSIFRKLSTHNILLQEIKPTTPRRKLSNRQVVKPASDKEKKKDDRAIPNKIPPQRRCPLSVQSYKRRGKDAEGGKRAQLRHGTANVFLLSATILWIIQRKRQGEENGATILNCSIKFSFKISFFVSFLFFIFGFCTF